jgi:hypothetical protein
MDQFIEVHFNLHRPFGLEIGRDSMRVIKLVEKGQGKKQGIIVGWQVKKVGRDSVKNMEEFVEAVAKRRNRGDAEVILYFDDNLYASNRFHEHDEVNNATLEYFKKHLSDDPTRDAKRISSETMDVIRVPSSTFAASASANSHSLAQHNSLLDAAIRKGKAKPLTKSSRNNNSFEFKDGVLV